MSMFILCSTYKAGNQLDTKLSKNYHHQYKFQFDETWHRSVRLLWKISVWWGMIQTQVSEVAAKISVWWGMIQTQVSEVAAKNSVWWGMIQTQVSEVAVKISVWWGMIQTQVSEVAVKKISLMGHDTDTDQWGCCKKFQFHKLWCWSVKLV